MSISPYPPFADPSIQTPSMVPIPQMDQVFKKIAQKAARTYMAMMPPCAPGPIAESLQRELAYLPIDVATEEKFEPHGWVITAMYRAMEIGKNEAEERCGHVITHLKDSHEVAVQALRNQLERYELIERIRVIIENDTPWEGAEEAMRLVRRLSDMR